jgi:transcriptional antiterminator RfaH
MWYVVYTKPGREDSVAFLLKNAGIEVLNPKLRSKKYRHNRYADVIEPLFPCYLFAHFDVDEYAHLITYTRGVRYIVGKRSPVEIHDSIIGTIKERMGDDNIIIVSPQKFEKGEKVCVREGPLKNLCGIFEREVKGPERVMILLNTIHCRVEIDTCSLSAA